MLVGGYRLGVDFGTSNTVAVLRWPDGRTRPLLFDGSPLLPSAVYAEPGAGLAVGRGAVLSGRVHPERFEPHPKRCIDHGRVLLGDPGGVPVPALIEAVLARVAGEAARIAGGPVTHTALCCPAGWAATRRGTLTGAASRVFPRLSVVAEPVAAASHFLAAGRAVPPGGYAMVYDLGAGTFDASVVRRVGRSFEVLAVEGLADAGGLDIDAAVVAYLGATYAARDPATWARLVDPDTTADRRASRTLWDDVRMAKESLSRSTAVELHVPLFDDTVPFGREQLEQLAHPILRRTVGACRSALQTAGVAPRELAGILLVGGASRIPLAATLLHRELGRAPTTIEQPELAVAEGSLHALTPAGPAVAAPPPPRLSGPPPLVAASPPASRVPRTVVGAAIAVLALLVGLVTAAIVIDGQRDDRSGQGSSGDQGRGNLGAGPTGSPSVPEIDRCLVGTWLETRHTIRLYDTYVVTGSGAVHRVSPDGRATVDYGDGVAFTNPAQLGVFRITWTGTITQRMVTSGNQIHTRDAKAEGTVVTESVGGFRSSEKMQAAPGPFDYRCEGDSATLTLPDGQEIELQRTSTG